MQNLNLDTGIIELAIQGDSERVLRFNPTDESIVKGFLDLLENANKALQEADKKEKQICDPSSGLGNIEIIKQKNKVNMDMDVSLREELDILFGAGTSEMVFGKMCVTAITSNGIPVFMGFLHALLKVIQEEHIKRNKRVEGIVAKYKPQR